MNPLVSAKKMPLMTPSAPLTRFVEERGLGGALQELQRGSRPSGTTQIIL